jgi:TonB family protein
MPEAWKKWEGQVVNEEFQLLRYLGGSEHSAVFLTKRADREPQEVAIKLTRANAENPELQLSWWELAARLSHPHLLRLFQRGRCQLDGTELIYVVTEYAEESLAQILPSRALTPAETRDMLQSALDALAYVHTKGFVHGHIKPANIMAVGNQVKVSSDGLCGAGESSRVLGTHSIYAAPEIANGGGMTPASDIWSLGMTLIEALTQSPPVWQGTGQAEVVLPETLPEPFFDIASHCLGRNPQRRWTVSEIVERLEQPSPEPQAKEMVQPKSASAKWSYAVPAMVAGLILVGILGSRQLHRHAGAQSAESGAGASSEGQQVPTQGTDAVRSAPIPGDKGKAHASSPAVRSNAPPAAAKTRVMTNAAASHSIGAHTPGAIAQQALPEVSRSALRTIHGKVKVRVKVRVDSSGNVMTAKFDSHGSSRYFADRSLQAAQRWTFKPPQVDGQDVPSEWILKFEFERGGTSVQSTQAFP